jgi:hypothetical protein
LLTILYHLDRVLGARFLAVSALLALLKVHPREVAGEAFLVLGRRLNLERFVLALRCGAALQLALALRTVNPWNLQ